MECAGISRVSASGLILDIVENFTGKLNVVIGKLADLGIVDAKNLSILGSAQSQAGDHVHDEQD